MQFIENVKFADMEQALVTLATKNELVIGVGGQTAGLGLQGGQALSQSEVLDRRRQQAAPRTDNVAQYDVSQAEIAFVAGAPAAMLSKNGARQLCRRPGDPGRSSTRARSSATARKYINPNIKYFESYTGDFDDVAKSKEATLAAIAQGADIHYHILNLGLRGMEQAAREKNTHIIGSYTDRCGTDPLYVAYTITGVGFQVRVRHRAARGRHLEAGVQAVRPGDGTEGLRHGDLQGHDAAAEGQARGDQEGPAGGQDQGVWSA